MNKKNFFHKMHMISEVATPFYYGLFIVGQISLTQLKSSALFLFFIMILLGFLLWLFKYRFSVIHSENKVKQYYEKEGGTLFLLVKPLLLLYSLFSIYLSLYLCGTYFSWWIPLPFWGIVSLLAVLGIITLFFYRFIVPYIGAILLGLTVLTLIGILVFQSPDSIGPIPVRFPTSYPLYMTILLFIPSLLEPLLFHHMKKERPVPHTSKFRLILVVIFLLFTGIIFLQSESYLTEETIHLFPIWQSLSSTVLSTISLLAFIFLSTVFRLAFLAEACSNQLQLRFRPLSGTVILLGLGITIFLNLYPLIQSEIYQIILSISSTLLFLLFIFIEWIQYRLIKIEKAPIR